MSTDTSLRRWVWRDLGAVALGLLFAGSLGGLLWPHTLVPRAPVPRAPAPARVAVRPAKPECRPKALAVVAGDEPEYDVAYVLDTCGRVERRLVREAKATGR